MPEDTCTCVEKNEGRGRELLIKIEKKKMKKERLMKMETTRRIWKLYKRKDQTETKYLREWIKKNERRVEKEREVTKKEENMQSYI